MIWIRNASVVGEYTILKWTVFTQTQIHKHTHTQKQTQLIVESACQGVRSDVRILISVKAPIMYFSLFSNNSQIHN